MNDNLIVGILVVLLCAIGYFYSWKFQQQDNFKIAVFLLLLCGLILRIYTSFDFFLHVWDERYHSLVAKNLIQHPLKPTLYNNPILPYNYKNWTGNNVWLAKPPVPLWSMALSIYLFGQNEIAVRFPSLIVSTLAILLTFRIAQTLFNNKIAWLAALLHSLHGMLIELAAGRISSDHAETFFIFWVELAVWLGILAVTKKEKQILFLSLCGVFTGMAFLSKMLPAFIVLPVWLSLAFFYKKNTRQKFFIQFIVLVVVSLSVSLPWFIYIFLEFPEETKDMLGSQISPLNTVIQNHKGPFWFYLNNIRIVFGEIIYIPLIWVIYKAYKNSTRFQYLPLLLWIMIPLLTFSFAETKRHTYLLIAAPAIFTITSVFWYWLSEYKKNHRYNWFFTLILFLIIALPVRYSIERVKPFEKINRRPQWAVDLKKLNEEKITNGVLFNCEHAIEAMFYTNLTAYPNIPDKNTLIHLIAQGYTVLINDNGSIPNNIKEIKGLRIINLTAGNS